MNVDRHITIQRGSTARPASLGDGGIERSEDLPRLSCESAAGLSCAHHPARSLEELDTELGLDLSDRLGERRLGDAEALGGAAEVQLFIDR